MEYFQIRKKVHWSDTDAAGVAWFPNFLGWFEDAEEEMFASLGQARQALHWRLRVRGAGKKQEVMPVDAFVARVTEEVRTRALAP